MSYPTGVGSGGNGGPLSRRKEPEGEKDAAWFVGFGGGGGGRSSVNWSGEAGRGIDRAALGGCGGIGGGASVDCERGGACCCCLDITGGSLAKISLRIARKSSTLDFYIFQLISISAKKFHSFNVPICATHIPIVWPTCQIWMIDLPLRIYMLTCSYYHSFNWCHIY